MLAGHYLRPALNTIRSDYVLGRALFLMHGTFSLTHFVSVVCSRSRDGSRSGPRRGSSGPSFFWGGVLAICAHAGSTDLSDYLHSGTSQAGARRQPRPISSRKDRTSALAEQAAQASRAICVALARNNRVVWSRRQGALRAARLGALTRPCTVMCFMPPATSPLSVYTRRWRGHYLTSLRVTE